MRESPDPGVALIETVDALPEIINRAANWYLSGGQVATPDEIAIQPEEEVLPGLPFGTPSPAAQERLLALLRHKVRQVYAPYMVEEVYRL